MYEDADLEGAIAAGALSREAADAFRLYIASNRATPAADEEHFRLLTGFNDIFVTIAIVILGVALAWIGNALPFPWLGAAPPGFGDYTPPAPSPLGALLVATAAWPLAEYFTRKRHMALPSIFLLAGFIGGVAIAIFALGDNLWHMTNDQTRAFIAAGGGLAGAGAAWFHWHRFKVPITVAMGCAAALGLAISLVLGMFPAVEESMFILTLIGGLLLFALAMWWDMSDPARVTRRSDVAFWLHLTAAPMMAHSLFKLLGVFDGEMSVGKALVVLALYCVFALVSLAVDRRALLVSSLAYVLYALYALFEKAGVVELSAAFTALVIGSALLLLSALWGRARALVLKALPALWVARLPHLK